jgi:hypothetical protein
MHVHSALPLDACGWYRMPWYASSERLVGFLGQWTWELAPRR